MSSAQFTLSTKDITPNSATVVVTLGIQYASPETATIVVETDGIVVYNDVFTIPAGDVGDTVDIPLTSLKSNTTYTATITSMSAYSDLINFSTPTDNTPKVATQTQWEDLISKIDCKYSEFELDTGATWFDGKKIYKKTFSFNLTNAETNVPAGVPNTAKLVKVEGTLYYGHWQHFMPFYSTSTDFARIYLQNPFGNTVNLTIHSGSTYYDNNTPVIVTIYYTKD